MKLTTAKQKLVDAALTWHASKVLAGERGSRSDAQLHKIACRYLRTLGSARKR